MNPGYTILKKKLERQYLYLLQHLDNSLNTSPCLLKLLGVLAPITVLLCLLEVVLVLSDLFEQLETLLDEVLTDDLEDLALLEHLTGDVEGQILGVDNALAEVQVLGDKVLAVVHDKHATYIQLDVVALLLVLEHVEGGTLGHEDNGAELELT